MPFVQTWGGVVLRSLPVRRYHVQPSKGAAVRETHGSIGYTVTVFCPGLDIVTTPPMEQIIIPFPPNMGKPFIVALGEPGIQGPAKDGTQATLVSEHIPNGRIFTAGLLSMTVAKGAIDIHPFTGNTFSTEGAFPKEQFSRAPPHTAKSIAAAS